MEVGADPNAPDSEMNGMTAMHCAAVEGKSVEVPEALRARMVQEDALQAAAVASRSDASRMRGWAAYPVLATDLRVAAALLA